MSHGYDVVSGEEKKENGGSLMKVCIVADVLGPENNGTTTACMNLVRYLRSCGDEVRIVCCDQDKRGQKDYYVTRVYNLGPIINYMVERNNVSLARPDRKVIAEAMDGVDIVHVMMPFALGRAAARIATEKHIPVTAGFHVQAENFTAHIGMMNLPIANRITYHVFDRTVYRKMAAIHYPTDFIRNTFEGAVHHGTNGYVISNGVHDTFRHQPAEKPLGWEDRFVILFTGRYSQEKSHKVLIRAVAKSKYRDRIQLIFAGQGPEAESMQRLATRLNILPPVMQFFSREELLRVINYADLYCHPAEIEIEAIACLEAITCGLVPVIADSPRCATKAFALTENNLFRVNDAKDLAAKIDYWMEHPREKAAMQEQYLNYTRNFQQTACMQAMRDMLCTYAGREQA